MDKETFITIDNIYRFQKIEKDKVELLLREFMKDKDIEKYNSIEQYIPFILSNPLFYLNANFYIQTAICYFERKFEVNKLYDKDNKVILIY